MAPKACIICGQPSAGTSSRCVRHQRKRPHYEGAWPAISRARRQAHPICEICGERPSTQVDHIVPRSLEGGIRAVCRPCHDAHGASTEK